MIKGMDIRTLAGTEIQDVYACFCEAFKNYVIPLNFDEEMTYRRWEIASVDFELSYGVFHHEKLVAFILNSHAQKILNHFAIGVVPDYRGRHLVHQILQQMHVDRDDFISSTLEVIKENTKAVDLYQKLNFSIERELVSMMGNFQHKGPLKPAFSYKQVPLHYHPELKNLRRGTPSFENSSLTTLQKPLMHEQHELWDQGKLIAYAIFTPTMMSLKEFGFANQRIENLSELFYQMKLDGKHLRVMNLEGSDETIQTYFSERGVKKFVTQFEMIKQLGPPKMSLL